MISASHPLISRRLLCICVLCMYAQNYVSIRTASTKCACRTRACSNAHRFSGAESPSDVATAERAGHDV